MIRMIMNEAAKCESYDKSSSKQVSIEYYIFFLDVICQRPPLNSFNSQGPEQNPNKLGLERKHGHRKS